MPPPEPGTFWHRLDAAETRARLGCGTEGLSEDEAAARRQSVGFNRLPEKPPRPAWAVFLDQFRNLLTLMLLAAGLAAGLVGDTTDMVVVLAVTLFNATLGYAQERRAGRMLGALKAMLAQKARVRRAGTESVIAAEGLVPGDLVLLKAGDRVPADGRLVDGQDVEADEASLTGESEPVAKTTQALDRDAVPLAERVNMLFMNTVVTRGRAEMVVTATGPATEMGKVAALLDAAGEGQTPLQERLDQLGRRLSLIAAVVVAFVLVQGLATGEPLAQVLLTAVALAVAAIPEGLPAVVTVTLALGMVRMAGRGAVIRRLAAVETLGSTSVICSDKTGTLTLGRMTALEGWALERAHAFAGDDRPVGLESALAPAGLCTEARLNPATGEAVGDPTEVALLRLAERAGALPEPGRWRRLAERPFSSDAKLMATLDGDGAACLLSVKGAPDRVLDLCDSLLTETGPRPLDEEARQAIAARMEEMGGRALRVIALAARPASPDEDLATGLKGLTLHALIGLADPPRPGAAQSIATCRAAGITVKMITGDHRVTAGAVARELGLDGEVVSGADLDCMSDAELAERVAAITVFARVTPEHKVRIVQALKARGHVTAMTGDGVNDAAALRNADIGVAMGRTGSDVTREAAAMVLTGDDFSTVVGAVREGRIITDNIVKFVRFQLSTNIGALLAVLLAPLCGLPVPFSPIQILWVNIIMDGPPAMALAFDPARRGLMEQPPRGRDAPILPLSRLARLFGFGLLMALCTLGVLWWEGGAGQDMVRARTMAFTTFVLFQVFNVFNARVGAESALGAAALANGKLWTALAGILALQAVAVHWGPAQALFHTTDLGPAEWAIAVALGASVLVLEEMRKLALRLPRLSS
ncbi:Cation transport ATPase(ATPase, P-type cation-transporter, N-terminal,10-75;ATPase, P-type, ATPase-associated domain,89-322;ATPase, P-type, cytoplasmic domain N,322-522;ATPase, P-type, transmembrane domain,578-868) [Magnetospirillum sp. XM-1]|uniref:cation-translocating P-type ATPase n=1 Tax=Magnetospirillum sp. XM-1 TaxID=1663591 RepID=UPI00073DBD29|nr:cation-transporting P-type ATPase [Magnetospirillum sp. XM-1]CUW38538.1 Cation transport ATPase(ATPase, P-type cation-transporter, N-terminal,10-75;ATPase, P-type, ATPase-associated domain,89-322;ATPase, P-type, cytoplasmic domain N,322-522;ATPase, P-type, transmembrane domain,578-868) [Magnetospirillum sp. XM-1]